MVKNSTNINKAEKTSPEHKKSMIHGVGRPGSNLGHAQKGDKFKPIHGIPFPSDNWRMANNSNNINKANKTLT